MSKIKTIKQEIEQCSREITCAEAAYIQAKAQFSTGISNQYIPLYLCAGSFIIGFCYAAMPKFKTLIHKTAGFALNNGIVIKHAIKLLTTL